VKNKHHLHETIVKIYVAGLLLTFVAGSGWAQEMNTNVTPATLDVSIHELQEQVRELRAAVAEMRVEAAQYRSETVELRQELKATRDQLAASAPAATPPSAATDAALANRVAALEESSQLLAGKVDDQYQTKIESGSKYKVRLSGLVLLNLFDNRGVFDNADFPSYVPQRMPLDSGSSLGATFRQSALGLEVFGPRLAGARTSGNLQVDFAGGFPSTLGGANFGLLRLRIASMRMDWQNTSLVVGQDNLFISPESPTSYASLAIPALGYQGNLWAWTPQIRIEHRFRFSDDQSVLLQSGVLDNFTGEPPFVSFERRPQAGEASGQPAFGVRMAWTGKLFGQPFTVGTAGYYSRQNWGFDRDIDGWAGMMDWDIPLGQHLSLSGELYRGRAIGGLGGGIGRSTLYSGSIFDPTTRIIGLDSTGGWSQLKVKATSKLEFNGAFGLDNPYAADVRAFPVAVSYFEPTLVQNRSAFVNFVYHPRSNLLFSSEYRWLRTYMIDNGNQSAGQVNLIMGVLF
jgi:hypothetical protein